MCLKAFIPSHLLALTNSTTYIITYSAKLSINGHLKINQPPVIHDLKLIEYPLSDMCCITT